MADFRDTAQQIIQSYIAGMEKKQQGEKEFKDRLAQMGIIEFDKKDVPDPSMLPAGWKKMGERGGKTIFKVPTAYEIEQLKQQGEQKEALGKERATAFGEQGYTGLPSQLANVPEEDILNRLRIASGASPLDVGIQPTVSAIENVPVFKKPAKPPTGLKTPEELAQEKELITHREREQLRFAPTGKEPTISPRLQKVFKLQETLDKERTHKQAELNKLTAIGLKLTPQQETRKVQLQNRVGQIDLQVDKLTQEVSDTLGYQTKIPAQKKRYKYNPTTGKIE